MRIGFFARGLFLGKGGIQRFCARISRSMYQRGHECIIFHHGSGDGKPLYPLPEEVQTCDLSLNDVDSLRRARGLVRDTNLDVLCVMATGTIRRFFLYICNNTGLPLLMSERCSPYEIETFFVNRWERLACFAAADGIHLLSQNYLPSLPAFLQQRTTVIPNPALPFVPVDWDKEKALRKRLLSVARLEENQKRLSLLIHASSLLVEEFPDWDWYICGNGPWHDEYAALINDLGLESRVKLVGPVDDVESWYMSSHLFCLPSAFEGCPNALLEAQSYGLPAVGFSECPGVNELIIHGENGMLAPEMTPACLAETLRPLMSDDSLRRSMGEKAREAMRIRYDEENIFDQWEEMLQKTAAYKNRTHLNYQQFTAEEHTQLALRAIPSQDSQFENLKSEEEQAELTLRAILSQNNPFVSLGMPRSKKRKPQYPIEARLRARLRKGVVNDFLPKKTQKGLLLMNNAGKAKTVSIYCGALNPGGAERQAVILARALSYAGIAVHIICTKLDGRHGHYLDLLKNTKVKIHALNQKDLAAGAAFAKKYPSQYLPISNFSLHRVRFYKLLGKLAAIAPDILHCYLDHANCIGGCAGLHAGIPGILLSIRNMDPKKSGKAYDDWVLPIYKFLQPRANVRLEANSRQGAEDYAKWLDIPFEKIAINHNGIDPNNYTVSDQMRRGNMRRLLNIGDNTPVVLYIARNVQQKCPVDMLDIAALLRKQIPDVHFLVAGRGFERAGKFAPIVRERGLADTVRLLGLRNDIPDLLAAGDILLLTSRAEGLPNAAMEAMCTGLPVVATSVGGVPDLVRHGTDGIIHTVGDVGGMADSLELLLSDPALRQNMGKNARERMVNNFTVDKLVNRTLNQYAALLGHEI